MGLSGLDHEMLLVRRGARSGAYTIVAVHSAGAGSPRTRTLPTRSRTPCASPRG